MSLGSVLPLKDGAKKGFEPVDVGQRPKMAARIDDCGWQIGRGATRVDRRELGCARKKRVGDVFVFFSLARTCRIDQPPARRDDVRRLAEHLKLRGSQQRKIALTTAPPDIGIPPQDAQAGTGRINEHAVESTRERQRPQ